MTKKTIDETRTRIVGMKWVKLGEGKDPEFLKTVLLCRVNDNEAPDYEVGYLKGIELEKDIKAFKFVAREQEVSTFTHYAIPTVPI